MSFHFLRRHVLVDESALFNYYLIWVSWNVLSFFFLVRNSTVMSATNDGLFVSLPFNLICRFWCLNVNVYEKSVWLSLNFIWSLSSTELNSNLFFFCLKYLPLRFLKLYCNSLSFGLLFQVSNLMSYEFRHLYCQICSSYSIMYDYSSPFNSRNDRKFKRLIHINELSES